MVEFILLALQLIVLAVMIGAFAIDHFGPQSLRGWMASTYHRRFGRHHAHS